MLLFVVQFYTLTSRFTSTVIAALPDAETGGTIATLLFITAPTYNGVMDTHPRPLPSQEAQRQGYTAGQLAIQRASTELSVFNPPTGSTCGQYHISPQPRVPPAGRLQNAGQYLASSNIYAPSSLRFFQFMLTSRRTDYSERWRNWGMGSAYIG
ncbi:hypothetical protein CFD26_104114 [Aspergillus turcosus]|uniref:Uncharacterized protein n=1 Tax=Aspergillus turcosus TaxID=1245748 RepID=A0A421CWJ6_9EURO|nr:hypothetical protein CFD26_104114 [Aspergillus turcosus]